MQNDALYRWLSAAALLVGAIASSALIGFVAGGWKPSTLGYVAWALIPYALLAAAHVGVCLPSVQRPVRALLAWANGLIALGGPLLYLDAMFWHVDAQGALAVLMVPLIQAAPASGVILVALIWQWRIKQAANHATVPAGESVPGPITSSGKSALMRRVRIVMVIGALLYLAIAALQRSDSTAIGMAKEVDAFVVEYCASHRKLPPSAVLHARFPNLNRDTGWFFFTNDTTYLKMQYPVSWWNSAAIGERRISEFTATPYAYMVEYQCRQNE